MNKFINIIINIILKYYLSHFKIKNIIFSLHKKINEFFFAASLNIEYNPHIQFYSLVNIV